IFAVVLCVVQSFLIAGLLAERRSRRRAKATLRDRLKFETLLSEPSADFTRLPANEIDEAIENWLQRLARFLGVDSAKLLADSELLPALKSCVLAIPIRVGSSRWTLAFSSTHIPPAWPADDLLPRLRLAGEILAGTLVRKADGEALQETQERYKLATKTGA